MAVSKSEIQITWGGSALTQSIAASGSATSDNVGSATIASTVELTITCKAVHSGTPASGDTVDFFAIYINGDVDGDSVQDQDTTGHAELIARLNLNTETPAVLTRPVLAGVKDFKLHAVNNAGASVTVSAKMLKTDVT